MQSIVSVNELKLYLVQLILHNFINIVKFQDIVGVIYVYIVFI